MYDSRQGAPRGSIISPIIFSIRINYDGAGRIQESCSRRRNVRCNLYKNVDRVNCYISRE